MVSERLVVSEVIVNPGPTQTGLRGAPREPFVISFAAVGFEDSRTPELRDEFTALRGSIESIRGRERSEGTLDFDHWYLRRTTPGGRQRSFTFQNGEVDEAVWSESLDGVPVQYDELSLHATWWGSIAYEAPSHFYVDAGRNLRCIRAEAKVSFRGAERAAEELIERLRAAAAVEGVVTGFVHLDSVNDPYTQIIANYSRLTGDPFDVIVHGYYWAVLLGPGHLDALGGVARVLAEAPCSSTEVLATPSGDAVLCRLTDSPLDLSEEAILPWRSFLAPVLRPGYPTGWGTVGTDSRYRAPVWLFEGEPAVKLTRFILARGDAPPVGPVPVEWAETEEEVEDVERPTCWVYPGPGFSPGEHEGLMAASIRAWALTAAAGRLAGVKGRADKVSDVTWDRDEAGEQAMVVQIGLDDPEPAVERLAALLATVNHTLGASQDRRVLDRIRIA